MTVQEKQSGLFPEGSDEDLRLRGFGGRAGESLSGLTVQLWIENCTL